ncbi:MAG: glycoside hydrolase family 66 protein [Calditrichaceae bacterium]
MIKNIMSLFCVFIILSCGSNTSDEPIPTARESGRWFAEVHTDKASYKTGEKISFFLSFHDVPHQDSELLIRYRYLNTVLDSQEIKTPDSLGIDWQWNPPDNDYRGYLAEVFLMNKNRVLDQTNIAVDVSSDWRHFPRYGFLSRYPELSQGAIDSVISRLNRHHINGIQFYDWHFKHHMPLSMNDGRVTETWPDIAKRTIHRETIEKYLEASAKYGMKTMAYNLLYGSWEDGPRDGAPASWRLYRDQTLKEPVKIDFDTNWSSDIYWMNPGNKEWQNYIFYQTKKVFDALPFDGWHVDQLGDWGNLWTADGREIKPDTAFGGFLISAGQYLKRPLVMNAVLQYGQEEIARGPVEFLYSEVWDPDSTYVDLLRIISENDSLGKYQLQTVLAAYVNQGLAEKPGQANNASVLLADALIFAAGGDHLELGEHLLVHPYFPNNNLKMNDALQKSIIDYYDFMVAYQNLLRGHLKDTDMTIESDKKIELSKIPEKGKIWYSAKTDNKRSVVQLVNFSSATTMNWRDDKGIQTEPDLINQFTISFNNTSPIRQIWYASPDFNSGSPFTIPFKQDGDKISLQLPGLRYWSMLVIERQEN